MLFKSEIDDAGAEIPPRCHIKPHQRCPRPLYPYLHSLVKVVLFGEIEVNPSDVKHVMKLVGYSDGPDVVIMAHTRRWDVIWGP